MKTTTMSRVLLTVFVLVLIVFGLLWISGSWKISRMDRILRRAGGASVGLAACVAQNNVVRAFQFSDSRKESTMIRKTYMLVIALLLAALVLAACGRDNEPTPEALPPTAAPEPTATPEAAQPAEAAPAASEAVTTTEEVTGTEATTGTEEAAPAEEVTATEVTTGTEEAAPAGEVTATEATTATEEVAPAGEVTATEATTATEEVSPTEEVTASEGTTETAAGAMVETTPQTVTGLQVDSARSVNDILNDKNAAIMVVSPDGKYIAYATYSGHLRNRAEDLCIYSFANATPQCYPRPEGHRYTTPALRGLSIPVVLVARQHDDRLHREPLPTRL